ncbi:ABC transporter ATP-binding protein [Salinicola aestuarinus]|uniref:ABC transporter ATP-binding protein n=1 Tax=Salinicola aestuarinus TaxID=1949082 RepID=UPI000DA21D4A|nr:ABC transporter ATP-binding protein [Salinicola aestuarinus]
MSPLLTVDSLTITTRAGLNLVDQVSFSLAPGEMLGLVGESGSGKTLTCRALLQLLPEGALQITGGRVDFDGRDLLRLSPREMRQLRGAGVGMIFQNPSTHINPLMTIGQQMAESLRLRGRLSRKEIRARSVSLLEQVGIPSPEQRLDSHAHEFSGGMRQRAMIAIALACSPRVLIADEPTTALDVTVQAQILKLLDGLRREHGLSIIMITHDLGVVAQTCDRVAVLYGGRICEIAATADLLKHPAHPYTRGLIACQPHANVNAQGPLTTIAGAPPTAEEMPAGCRFHPRCPDAQRRCQTRQPVVHDVAQESGHRVACHYPLQRLIHRELDHE